MPPVCTVQYLFLQLHNAHPHLIFPLFLLMYLIFYPIYYLLLSLKSKLHEIRASRPVLLSVISPALRIMPKRVCL